MISAPNSAGTNSANCAKLLCSRSRKVMRRLRVGRAVDSRTHVRGHEMAGGSITRPPLHIEDGASMAFRADEPVAPPRVAEPEGTASDRSRGQTDGAPRTLRRLPRGHRRPYPALFV